MKSLVTGSSGFIGGHLVRYLLQRGHDVSCLVRAASRTGALAGLPLTLVSGSYFDLESLRRAVRGMDYVFHAGAVLSAPDWPGYFKTNVEGTANILEACAQANPEPAEIRPGFEHFRRRTGVGQKAAAGSGWLPAGIAVREKQVPGRAGGSRIFRQVADRDRPAAERAGRRAEGTACRHEAAPAAHRPLDRPPGKADQHLLRAGPGPGAGPGRGTRPGQRQDLFRGGGRSLFMARDHGSSCSGPWI